MNASQQIDKSTSFNGKEVRLPENSSSTMLGAPSVRQQRLRSKVSRKAKYKTNLTEQDTDYANIVESVVVKDPVLLPNQHAASLSNLSQMDHL